MAGPAEIPRISVTLSVRNGMKAVAFYKAAFGAEELFVAGNEATGIVAQLAFAQRDFWLADESRENSNFSPETLGGSSVRMMLVIDDPDALAERAVAAGATLLSPVADQHYGWRVGRLVDPFGHHWEIARPDINQ